VLVEFPRGGLPPGATAELVRLRDCGVVPVVAHPERYRGCTADLVREWRGLGAVIQTDAMMLLGTGPMTELARELLELGLIDCLASDNHGDGRTLATSRRWLEELDAAPQAALLTAANPARLLADQPVLPVAPVRLERGVLDRLRQIVFGRA
jgi:protein-tyrosine phosphatase